MSVCESILSLNVRGLRDVKKRSEVFRWLQTLHNGANSIVFLQETHTSDKDLLVWEHEWGSKILMSHGTTNSKGVAILFPKNINFKIESEYFDKDGRMLVLCITYEQIEYCLINVYCPTQDHEKNQLDFLDALQTNIEANIDKKIIIGGDFNLCLKEIDKSNPSKRSKARDKLNNVMDQYDLLDIWRLQHPEIKRYTWRRHKPLVQSRLDYWLVSADMSYNISSCDIKPSIKTDHSLISLNFTQYESNKRGSGLWKFNSSLLSDPDYVGYMEGMINLQINNFKDITNNSLKWELIKMEIRTATIAYSKTQANLRNQYEKQLNEQLIRIDDMIQANYSETLLNQYNTVKEDLEKINAMKTEGQRIRSKAIYVEHNEKGSKFFIGLEKHNANIKNITRLKLDSGIEITKSQDILNELNAFYENLYSAGDLEEDTASDFFNENVPTISPIHALLCDQEIDIEECFKALMKMKGEKSPGTDGLTVEFYKYFWQIIKHLVFNSIKAAFINKQLSSEQKRGVLRLIPKKGKDLTSIKNWRPISLLNTDYKLLTHILSNRLQEVLPSVISLDQSGYLKDRNISINIRSIFDIIDKIKRDNTSGILAFLDFEKAFDKLDWIFIQNTLKAFGFGQVFKKWINIIYTDIESCIINNGSTSKYFSLKSGIRQGCPISALLFILAVELLAINLRNNKDIHGFNIGFLSFSITQLADDTTLFLRDIDSLKLALHVLHKFKNISGLKLNRTKTEILQIGKPLTSNYTLLDLKWEKEKIYALGTWFYEDYQQTINETYACRLQLLRDMLKIWSNRNLTWIGKITVIKTLCISKINFAISSIESPEWFINETKSLLEEFLWNGKPPRVKNKVMHNDYDKGGLRMPNLHYYVKAQKMNWIKLLLNNKTTVPYQYLSTFLCMKLNDYLKCNTDADDLPKDIPKFYQEILQAWFSMKEEPQTSADIQREVLWHNKYIKIGNKTIF